MSHRLTVSIGIAIAASVTPLACESARERGALERSSAGFSEWRVFSSGTDASLRGVAAVDRHTVWATGAGGTVLRTRDGGASWERLSITGSPDLAGLEMLDYRDVHALDAERAWILSAGTPAVILFTGDGGRSWSVQHRDDREAAFFDAMDFWDEWRGIAFGDPIDGKFLIVVTEDGGATWRELPGGALPAPIEGEAGFAGSGTCLRVFGDSSVAIGTGGAAARVLRSDDGGASWWAADTGMVRGESAGAFSVLFLDAERGLVVGGDYRQEGASSRVAARTVDGGRSWRVVDAGEGGPTGFRSSLTRLPGSGDDGSLVQMLAVGPTGTDRLVLAEELRCERVSELGFHAVSFADGVAWAVGAGGRIGLMAGCHPAAIDRGLSP